ncbi:MAG: AI-2E family transporter [Bacteroidota bacterium]
MEQPSAVHKRLTAFETALLAGAFALFVVLLFTLEEFLNPFIIGMAGLILLWPLRKYRTTRALLYAGGFLLLFWFFVTASSVLIPFAAVFLIAYVFEPLVRTAKERFKVPRVISALLLTSFVVGILVAFALILVPNIVSQLEILGTRLLSAANDLRAWVLTTPLLDQLEEAGVIEKSAVITQLNTLLQSQATALTNGIPQAAEGLLKSFTSVLEVVTVATILPVLLFYIIKDYPTIERSIVSIFPTFDGKRDYVMQAGGIVGNYLRGLLTISAIAAFNVTVLLVIFDIPFALLIGLLAGFLNMIPNLGALITMVLGVILGVVFGDPWIGQTLIIVAVLFGQSMLESTVLTPNILSYQVGLHPALILFALFVFGFFMGMFGLLIAVPTTALIITVYKAYREEVNFDLMGVAAPVSPTIIQRLRRRRAHRSGEGETLSPAVAPTEDA